MKKFYVATLFLILSHLTIAQNYGLNWVNQMGGTSDDLGFSITTDASGNIYTTGWFEGTVDFDPGVGITNLASAGSKDIFIQKLDASGNLLWVKQIGGTSFDFGKSITTDVSDNVYTTGRFYGTVDFDPGVGIFNLTSSGDFDIFILKLDAAGNFLWAKKMGGVNWDEVYSITTDVNGNVYTTGYFKDTVDFDPGAGIANLISVALEDIFILKLDSNGNLLWVKQIGGASDGVATSITIDASGNVYTTGSFHVSADFDPGVGTAILNTVGETDIFILKLDSAGNLLWVKQMGSLDHDLGSSITTDDLGNIYTTGYFQDTADFDPGAGITNLTSAGFDDIFIQKLDSAGNFLWAKKMGGTASDYGTSITTDASGNIYTTGCFNGTVDFDPGVGIVNLTSAGSYDIFIQKLDTAGNFSWIKQIGGTASDYGWSIATDGSENIYSTGSFRGIVDFNPGAGTTNLTSAGSQDIFIQKLSQCISTTGTDVVTACFSYTWIDGIAYTASNNTATHTLSNATGCDSVVTLNLTIDTVDISLNVSDPSITANATGALYQWLDCNNNFAAIAGETSQSFTATANGNYAVEVTQNTCVDTSQCVTISTVGINKNNILNQISVYPNPTTGKIFIEGENIHTDAFSVVERVEIINPIGQTIKQYTVRNKTILIDISSQTKGIYFVRITTNRGVVIDKVLLE